MYPRRSCLNTPTGLSCRMFPMKHLTSSALHKSYHNLYKTFLYAAGLTGAIRINSTVPRLIFATATQISELAEQQRKTLRNIIFEMLSVGFKADCEARVGTIPGKICVYYSSTDIADECLFIKKLTSRIFIQSFKCVSNWPYFTDAIPGSLWLID